MPKEVAVKRGVALALIVLLLVLIVVGLLPFSNGIFGALILFVLFRPLYTWLAKRIRPGLSSVVVLVVATLVIVLPFVTMLSLLAVETNSFLQGSDAVPLLIDKLDGLLVDVDVTSGISDILSKSGALIQSLLGSVIGGVAQAIVTLTLMYVFLFYLFVESGKAYKILLHSIPFNTRNSNALMKEFKRVTYSTVVSSGFIAVIQGALLGVGFTLFNFGNGLLLGFVAGLLSFIPGLGIVLVWLPAAVIAFLLGKVSVGVGIIVLGIVLSGIDNLLRPFINRKVGSIHPLTTLVGLFIGIPLFGLLGVIIGPLLLSYLFLTVKMFKQEYL